MCSSFSFSAALAAGDLHLVTVLILILGFEKSAL
jgi:hypothetical protein